jgi:hypothetical protein
MIKLPKKLSDKDTKQWAGEIVEEIMQACVFDEAITTEIYYMIGDPPQMGKTEYSYEKGKYISEPAEPNECGWDYNQWDWLSGTLKGWGHPGKRPSGVSKQDEEWAKKEHKRMVMELADEAMRILKSGLK